MILVRCSSPIKTNKKRTKNQVFWFGFRHSPKNEGKKANQKLNIWVCVTKNKKQTNKTRAKKKWPGFVTLQKAKLKKNDAISPRFYMVERLHARFFFEA